MRSEPGTPIAGHLCQSFLISGDLDEVEDLLVELLQNVGLLDFVLEEFSWYSHLSDLEILLLKPHLFFLSCTWRTLSGLLEMIQISGYVLFVFQIVVYV